MLNFLPGSGMRKLNQTLNLYAQDPAGQWITGVLGEAGYQFGLMDNLERDHGAHGITLTDRNTILLDTNFVRNAPPEEVLKVVAHESVHGLVDVVSEVTGEPDVNSLEEEMTANAFGEDVVARTFGLPRAPFHRVLAEADHTREVYRNQDLDGDGHRDLPSHDDTTEILAALGLGDYSWVDQRAGLVAFA